MPKIEPKVIQKELDQGILWPVYWIYGQERMKSRELVKRIRKAVLGEGNSDFGWEQLDGQETDAAEVLDAAQSLSLGGGTRLILVRESHLIKEPEILTSLFGPKAKREELSSVTIFLSKDLDARKKFSKRLLESAAVVACEEVAAAEREAWLGYLAKRKGLELKPEWIMQLCSLDPWSLDIIEQELEKFSVCLDPAVLTGGGGTDQGSEAFFEAFFGRNLAKASELSSFFSDQPDLALPLLGLFSWNVRQLALVLADRESGKREVQISPFLAERFSRWGRHWQLKEVLKLQHSLSQLDFEMKQTPRLALSSWGQLVLSYCQ